MWRIGDARSALASYSGSLYLAVCKKETTHDPTRSLALPDIMPVSVQAQAPQQPTAQLAMNPIQASEGGLPENERRAREAEARGDETEALRLRGGRVRLSARFGRGLTRIDDLRRCVIAETRAGLIAGEVLARVGALSRR